MLIEAKFRGGFSSFDFLTGIRSKLTYLDIFRANLKSINGEWFKNFGSHLYSLRLSRNEIEILRKEDFQYLTNLKHLSFYGNKLKRISPELRDMFSKLDVLNLIKNPDVCNCSLLWLFGGSQVILTNCSYDKEKRSFNNGTTCPTTEYSAITSNDDFIDQEDFSDEGFSGYYD